MTKLAFITDRCLILCAHDMSELSFVKMPYTCHCLGPQVCLSTVGKLAAGILGTDKIKKNTSELNKTHKKTNRVQQNY